MSPKQGRRQSREVAFELLFEWSFNEYTLEELLENAASARDIEPDKFARGLVERVLENYMELDALIESHSKNWKLGRISRVTLAALRIALCEMKYLDTPEGAAINEAVELVKKYGAQDESAYLNGILGSYARGKLPEGARSGR